MTQYQIALSWAEVFNKAQPENDAPIVSRIELNALRDMFIIELERMAQKDIKAALATLLLFATETHADVTDLLALRMENQI
jgi:hypothetical protein